ncbi:MAG: helix-turn-helix transcriptional regulator [Terriglobus sp.]
MLKDVEKSVRERFGERVRQLRAEHELTQEDLAYRSGVGRVFISQIENGHKEACLGVLDALAGSFKITLSELMKGV